MRVPQGADVERHGRAEAGEHRQPQITRGLGPGRHRGGQRAQAEPGGGLGRGRQMPHGARLQRRSVALLVRVQGPDAPPDVQGEGVGRLDVALAGGLGGGGGGGAQQLHGVLETAGIGNVPLAEGALLKGSVGVDRHG